MSKIVTRLLPLLLLLYFHSAGVRAQQSDHAPGLNSGDAVVTTFSGTVAPDAKRPRLADKSAIDLTLIDLESPRMSTNPTAGQEIS